MTIRIWKTILLAITLVLLTGTSALAEEAGTQKEPAAQAAGEPQPKGDMPCTEGGKCCGSSACAEAKRKSAESGAPAVDDCPCRKNRAKPKHNPQ